MNYEGQFQQRLSDLRKEGRYRVFADLARHAGSFPKAKHFRPQGHAEVTVWCSNDYLGMGQHPNVLKAMHEAIDTVARALGVRATFRARRTITSSSRLSLPTCTGKEQALLFTSAYVANDATIATLGRLLPGLIIFSDEKNHASMIEGIRIRVAKSSSGSTTTWLISRPSSSSRPRACPS